jgi:hypothetical protein
MSKHDLSVGAIMRRREFLSLRDSAAIALPFTAGAQQSTVGILAALVPPYPAMEFLRAAFVLIPGGCALRHANCMTLSL